ncbi:SAM-dependent methyltransferase [Actinoplanes sp. TFC3]|uniref:SAM-dependent methyltransferase n=1 Tax=Actinoplanes sp. TFC3 TaxID=1710355 RepID=UPI00082E1ADD|nr:SAM-dependent methyltransferase [Actinoplanes sp. TFC3]
MAALGYALPAHITKHEELVTSGRTDAGARTAAESGRFFDGLELIEPGIVAVSDWRPARPPTERPAAADVSIYGAVGRL